MNPVFYKISRPAERDIIDSICTLLSQRNFRETEKIVINHLNNIVAREYNTDDDTELALADLRGIYLSFNQYYLDWIEKNGKSKDTEIAELKNDLHSNLLFANMSDPESMDDLVYAIADYLTNNEDEQYEEAQYHLDHYTQKIA